MGETQVSRPEGALESRYCAEGDDSLLGFLFRDYRKGFYVEVGSNHPTRENATFLLYERGWSGLCIDANGDFKLHWARLRPRDSFVEAILAEDNTSITYVEYEDSTLNATTSLAHRKALEDGIRPSSKRDSITKTLTQLLATHVVGGIDLLSINARSADLAILKGLDLSRYRPSAIRIEMLYFSFEEPRAHPIYVYLRESGYVLVTKTFRNAFWVDPQAEVSRWIPAEMLV
jgi:hypothetical protein